MLGINVTKRNNKLWVNTINMRELKTKIQVNDIIRTINNVQVGNELTTQQSSVQPMYIEFVRKVLVKVLDDEAIKYYTDED